MGEKVSTFCRCRLNLFIAEGRVLRLRRSVQDAPLDSTHPTMQQLRPPPAAETGSSCWGSGQQDASAAQGTKRMLGAATRRQGLLAPFRPQSSCRSGKMPAASLKAFFALLRFAGPSAAAAAAPRRGAGAPSPSAPVGRIHLSQRERQEALPVCPWCPFKKEARSVPTTVLALPLGELANPKGLTERAKGSPFGKDSPGRGRWHEVPEGEQLALQST